MNESWIIKKECKYYHPLVHVAAQKKAVADREYGVKWIQEVLTPYAEEHYKGQEFILFMDNLDSQKSVEFTSEMKKIAGDFAYGPPNRTEAWQPIDCGHIGATLKALGKQKFEDWMEKTAEGSELSNWQRWEQNILTKSGNIILVTWVFGDAWTEYIGPYYSNQRRSAFEKGGCAVTLNGTCRWKLN